jgi:sugar phosphate isomerase/epimerase
MAATQLRPRLGLVTEAMADRPLTRVMDWLVKELPQVTDLEIGCGGYAPSGHCDMQLLLRDASARRDWRQEITARGLSIAALNVWGNPLHPDRDVATRHAADLRDAVRLAAELDVERVVALAGCPGGAEGDRTAHFAGGGWLPYLEGIHGSQWDEHVVPFWSAMAELARREHPRLLICLELHPGSVVYNVETFERIAELGESIAANIDPSHFLWMGMNPLAVVERLRARIGHAHGKDVKFGPDNLALNRLLDRRWPRPPEAMPWNFAVVGRGQAREWWARLVAELAASPRLRTIAIEHEDPFVAAEEGIAEAAGVLRA